MSEWVSVKDRLPDDGVPVLVCNTAGQVFTCRRSVIEGNLALVDTQFAIHDRYTHWMELPSLPEVEV
jgi:hypothetical protein